MDVTVETATPDDAEGVLALQKLAFRTEAERYGVWDSPPMVQTLDGLLADFADGVVLKATSGGRIVGSVRARMEGATCHVARLMVHPDARRRGIGTRLMQAIEARFRDALRFELDTGYQSDGNIRLYERLGYSEASRERVHERVVLVRMAKPGRASSPAAAE